MFYDWFLTYVIDGIFVWFVLLLIASVILGATIASKPGKANMGVTIGAVLSLTFMTIALLTPKRPYFEHYYGKPRQLTETQEKLIQKRLDENHAKSRELFIECLDKGQKQPNSTTFNYTNEVIKTCYNVARIKF